MAKKAKKAAIMKSSEGEVIDSKEQQRREARAMKLDDEIVSGLKDMTEAFDKSRVYIGTRLAEIIDTRLWDCLLDPKTSKCFKSPEAYASCRFGEMKKTKMYEMIIVSSLTQGKNALLAADVEKMGPKKAAEFAKLPPEKRTKKRAKEIQESTLSATKQIVNDELNGDLPKDERREIPVTFARSLASSVSDAMEKFEDIGLCLAANPNWRADGEERKLAFMDNDPQMTSRSKFWGFVVFKLGEFMADDFNEAVTWMKERKAQEERDAEEKKAAAAQSQANKKIAARAQPKNITTKPSVNSSARSDDQFPSYEEESQERGRPRAH